MRLISELTQGKLFGKAVLVRGDLDEEVKNSSFQFRLEALLPTLQYLLAKQAQIVLIGHRGRPRGRAVPDLSLRPTAKWLSQKLKIPVEFIAAPIDSLTQASFSRQFQLFLLENLRFDPREEENDLALAQKLASLADFYVNEAFAASHRPHASIVGVPRFLPSYSGLRLAQEIKVLGSVLKQPARLLVVILGGAKVETKEAFAKAFSQSADLILLGGKLMFSHSLEGVPKVLFPVDARRIDDIGTKTAELFQEELQPAGTIVWNGPMGRYEDQRFQEGTRRITEAVLNSRAKRIVVGGGDTLQALIGLGLLEKFQADPRVFLSTGGGAMLEYLADGTLLGFEALSF